MRISICFKIILYSLLIITLFIACDNKRIFENNKKIPNNTWNENNILIFKATIDDTTHPYNIYFNIRNLGSYKYCNLFLFVTTIAPSGQTLRDTVELFLADENGKWLGKGLGDIWFNQLYYKSFIRFKSKGVYTFNIQQGMRDIKLEGIIDVGLRIEKAI